MSDLRQLIRAGDAMAPGEEAVLATVVDVEGSSYRRPGARLLIGPRGERTGLVSGGCLEKDLVQRAFHLTAAGPHVVTYDTRADDEDYADDPEAGYGLGCNGVVHVLLQRVVPAWGPNHTASSAESGSPLVDSFAVLRGPIAEDRMVRLATVYRVHSSGNDGVTENTTDERVDVVTHGDASHARVGDCVRLDAEIEAASPEWLRGVMSLLEPNATAAEVFPRCVRVELASGHVDVLLEELEPPPRLVVFGAGDDAVPLVNMASGMGWRVTVVDHRRGYAEVARFPGAEALLHAKPEAAMERLDLDSRTSIVCMTHSLAADSEAVRCAQSQPHAYLGVLGPSHRTRRVLECAGVNPASLRSPVGLDLGAEGPAEIALSILAEVVACRHGRTGGFLSTRQGPIHPPTTREVAALREAELRRPPSTPTE